MGLKNWFDGLIEKREIPFEQKLNALEKRRKELLVERRRIRVYNVLFPTLCILGFLFFVFVSYKTGLHEIFILPFYFLVHVLLSLYGKYRSLVYQEITDLIREAKTSVLKYFMSEFHPNITIDYDKSSSKIYSYLEPLILVGIADLEDEILFKTDETEIYLAEVKLNRKLNYTSKFFKGLFLSIKLEEDTFIKGEIKSRMDVVLDKESQKGEWQNFKKFKGNSLSYRSSDDPKFLEEIEPILPILEHLSSKEKGLRVILNKDEINIFLETNMKLLNDPPLTLHESFQNEKFYRNLAKKINTFLFIAESLVKDLEKSEVEERLELKVLSMVPNDMIL